MTFTSTYTAFTQNITTNWLKTENGHLTWIPKGNARAEVQQASYLGYGLRRCWGGGPYGYLSITQSIKKIADEEIDSLIRTIELDLQTMQQRNHVLKEVQEVISVIERQHQIQEINRKQQELIEKVEEKFCSHYRPIRGFCARWSWRILRFTINLPSSIYGLFNHHVRLRNGMKKQDLNPLFMHMVSSIYTESQIIWRGINSQQKKISLHLLTTADEHILFFERQDQRLLGAKFHVDQHVLQTKCISYLKDDEAFALINRFFTNITQAKNLSISSSFPPSTNTYSYTNVWTSQSNNIFDCTNEVIERAHKIGKLSHLLSLSTILEAAQSLNAQNT